MIYHCMVILLISCIDEKILEIFYFQKMYPKCNYQKWHILLFGNSGNFLNSYAFPKHGQISVNPT